MKDWKKLTVFVASATLLFAELAVVRWTGSELVNLAFFKNLILIGAFLGAGLGIALGPRHPGLGWLAPPFLATLAVIVPFAQRMDFGSRLAFGDLDEFHWNLPAATTVGGSIGFLAFFALLFVISALTFAGLGVPVGRAMTELLPLCGYSWNLAGSLAGVLAFALASFLETPPAVWLAACAIPFALTAGSRRVGLVGGAIVAGAACFVHAVSTPAAWSPYSRLAIKTESVSEAPERSMTVLSVDGAYFMRALDLRADEPKAPLYRLAKVHYELPYRLSRPESVLVLGAGMGNDVAAALRAGVRRVDAVEIDPAIVAAGRRAHPEKPYDSEKVRIVVDDARSFLTRTSDRYDLIVLGLLDSHSLLAQLPGVRLDNYIYTTEALVQMRRHLTPNGILAISFAVSMDRAWLALKLEHLARSGFGEPPIGFFPSYDSSVMFLAGPGTHSPGFRDAAESAALAPYRIRPGVLVAALEKAKLAEVETPTDDWPHLYLRQRGLSAGHLALFVLLLPLAALAIRGATFSRGGVDFHFLLLGAGFLLVETKGIADLGLLFGGTWWTITAVIAAALGMALLSTLFVAWKRPRRSWPSYCALSACLLLVFFVRPATLLTLPLGLAQVLGALFVAAPVFFSGIVFAISFARSGDVSLAMGSNLLGSVLGGFLEYASMSLGIRALSLIALALYGLSAAALSLRGSRAEGAGARPGDSGTE